MTGPGWVFGAAVVAVCSFAACGGGTGSDDASGGAGFGSGGASGNSGASAGGSNSGGKAHAGGGASTGGSAGAGGGGGGGGSGGAQLVTGAVDMLVLFDVSGSTCQEFDGSSGCAADGTPTRLQSMKDGLSAFLENHASSAMAVGLQVFGAEDIGLTSCDSSDYETPLVPMESLAQNGAQLSDAIDALESRGETPTGAALRGSCSIARSFRAANPGRRPILLLVTDDEPGAPVTCQDGAGDCCPTLEDAVLAASECNSGADAISTYVVAVGPSLTSLQEIADAGGGSAYYVTQADQLFDSLEQSYADAVAAAP